MLQCVAVCSGVISCDFDNAIDDNTEIDDHVEIGDDMTVSKRSKILGGYLSRCAPISTSHVSNTLHDHVEIGNDDCDAAHCNYPWV